MKSLIIPMYAMVLLTFLVALRLLWVRATAIKTGIVKMSYFRSLSDAPPSDTMAIPARHFVNLFEVPVLFYAACIVALVIGDQSEFLVKCAWGFVACRIAQATIHLTYNNVRHRMVAYFLGFFIVLAMWTSLVCTELQK